jgi:hypothetical protein
VRRLEATLARAAAPRADANLIGRQIERAAVQRLDSLRAALNGPDAREALHALFPAGIRVRLVEDAYLVEAEGFPIDPAMSCERYGIRTASGYRTANRSPPWKRAGFPLDHRLQCAASSF